MMFVMPAIGAADKTIKHLLRVSAIWNRDRCWTRCYDDDDDDDDDVALLLMREVGGQRGIDLDLDLDLAQLHRSRAIIIIVAAAASTTTTARCYPSSVLY